MKLITTQSIYLASVTAEGDKLMSFLRGLGVQPYRENEVGGANEEIELKEVISNFKFNLDCVRSLGELATRPELTIVTFIDGEDVAILMEFDEINSIWDEYEESMSHG